MQKHPDQAHEVLQKGIQNNPDAAALYILEAESLYAEGKKGDAGAVLQQLRDRQPKSANVASAIGNFYAQRQETDNAIAEYKRGLSLEPKNIELSELLVDLYLNNNRLQDATTLNAVVLKQRPKDVIARLEEGRILLANGKKDEAIAELQKLATDAPDFARAHYMLAQAYGNAGQTAQAKNEYAAALKADPNMVLAMRSLAEVNLNEGHMDLAKEYASQSVQKAPADASGHLLMGVVLARSGDINGARDQFTYAQRLNPKDPLAHVDLAIILASQKKVPDAQKEFDQALDLGQNNITVLQQYANYLAISNQLPKAFAAVQQYVNAKPEDVSGHRLLGALQLSTKNYVEAEKEFGRAVQLDPNSAQTHFDLGRAKQASGDLNAAIGEYQGALKLQPKSVQLQTLIADLYLQKGDLDLARQSYEQVLSWDSNAAVANANLAWVYAIQGSNLDYALGLAQKAKQLLPEVQSITDTLAWVEYKKGSYAAAVPLLKDCVEKEPNHATFRYHLGMALIATGDKQNGKGQIQKALELKLPDDEAKDARHAIANL